MGGKGGGGAENRGKDLSYKVTSLLQSRVKSLRKKNLEDSIQNAKSYFSLRERISNDPCLLL